VIVDDDVWQNIETDLAGVQHHINLWLTR